MSQTTDLKLILQKCEETTLKEKQTVAKEKQGSTRKEQILSQIRDHLSKEPKSISASGYVELMPEGFGFLRTKGLTSSNWDVYIPSYLIRQLDLRPGDFLKTLIAAPNDRNLSVEEVFSVNEHKPGFKRPRFENLEALHPDKQLKLENKNLSQSQNTSMRILDLFTPVGKGQRCLILAPPRAGKTELLHSIAATINKNHKDMILLVLLIDERPEEVGLMKKVAGEGNVFSSTFDEHPSKHIQLAKLLFERAKRLVEEGHDVTILLDSLTRLTRGNNYVIPATTKILSGGIDAAAFYEVKALIGAARNTVNAGSLTFIGTVLIETGSKMDEVIAEEYKGTCNAEIILKRQLADKGIYPAITLKESGVRHADFFMDPHQFTLIQALRKVIVQMTDEEAMKMIIKNVTSTPTNEDFYKCIN